MKYSSPRPPAAAERILEAACCALEKREVNDCSIDDYLDYELSCPEYRRTVSDLLFSFYRHRLFVDRCWRNLVQKEPRPKLRYLLQAAATQILFQNGIASASAVNVAVSLARRRGGAGEGAFTNAILRKVAAISSDRIPGDAAQVFPEFVLDLFRRRRLDGEAVNRIGNDFLKPADFTLRCTMGFDFSEEERHELGLSAIELPFPGSDFVFYRAAEPMKILNHPGLARGDFYIQDPSTALALSGNILKKAGRYLDLCAAPGGKALQAAELMGPQARIVAADRSDRRQKLTVDNFARRNRAVEIEIGPAWELRRELGLFDGVLADVPCSNSGVFRRRPDAMWCANAGKLTELNLLQQSIARAAASFVAPGGVLIYSTCSIDPREDENIVKDFLTQHADFKLEAEQLLLPGSGYDGAYRAVLRRN